MKELLILLMVLLSVQLIEAQGRGHRFSERTNKKIEELEKIKLLEVLDMNEETSIKFFSRRREHKEIMRDLTGESEAYLEKMETALKNESDNELKGLIKDFLDNEEKIAAERINFINSVSDILSAKQIASLLVFEQRFREEIRNIILRERRKGRN